MTFKHSILAAGLLSAAALQSAQAEELRAATYLPDPNIHTQHAFGNFVPELAEGTNGELAFTAFTGGVLLPPKSILQGVSDGVAQMGFHTTGYTPSEIPISNALRARVPQTRSLRFRLCLCGLGDERPDW